MMLRSPPRCDQSLCVTRDTRKVRIFRTLLIFSQSVSSDLRTETGSIGSVFSGIGGFLRDRRLPYSDDDSEEGGDNQKTIEPRYSSIRFDLRSSELVLLIFASLAGCIFCTCRFIKNDGISFAVEGSWFIVLFTIGQGTAYLLCCRLEGL